MEKRADKLIKTYGRHKNRVIKTDIWDSKFNAVRENIFNLSNPFDDESDFIETRKTQKCFKRKKTKDENKENKPTKTKLGKKKKIDDNLFAEKETVSSFTDHAGGGGALKNLLRGNVPPASTTKIRLGNRTKLRFDEPQLQNNPKEKNVSVSFSEFDSYNLCVSDSPVQADAKTTETSTPKESDNMGKALSPEIFLKSKKKPFTRVNSFEPINQTNSILSQTKKSGITTSTPLLPFVALSRLPNTIKTSRTADDHSLFEQSHADSSIADWPRMTSFDEKDESIRFNNQTRPTKDGTTKNKNLSTPLIPFVALSRLPNTIKTSRTSDDHSLFEQSRADSPIADWPHMTSFDEKDESIRFNNQTRPTTKDGTTKNKNLNYTDDCFYENSAVRLNLDRETENRENIFDDGMDLSKCSLDESAVRFNRGGLGGDDSLDLSQRFDQIMSLGSKDTQSSSRKKTRAPLGTDNNSDDDGDGDVTENKSHRSKDTQPSSRKKTRGPLGTDNNSDDDGDRDGDVTENKSHRSHMEYSHCANCSLGHPCGDECVFVDPKLNVYVCLQKLEKIMGSIVKDEKSRESEVSSLDFDGSRDLMESYSHDLPSNHRTEERHVDVDGNDEVGTVSDVRGDLKSAKICKGMNSLFLSDVEEEVEELEEDSVSCNSSDEQGDEDLASSSADDDETDEEDAPEDVSYLYKCVSPAKPTSEIDDDHASLHEEDGSENVSYLYKCVSPANLTNVEPTSEVDDDHASLHEEDASENVSDVHLHSYCRSPYMTRSKLQISIDDSKMESLLCTPDNKIKIVDDNVEHFSRISLEVDDDHASLHEEDASEDVSYLYKCVSPTNLTNDEPAAEVEVDHVSLHESNSSQNQNCTSSPVHIVNKSGLTDESDVHLHSYYRSPYMTRSKLQISIEDSKMESLLCTPDNKIKIVDDNVEHFSRISLEMASSTPRKSLIAILSPKISQLSPRSKVLQQCEQDDFITFKECIPYSMMKNCVKIGEGAYGEVFRTKQRGQSVALKIIPIEGDFEVNECLQKNFLEIFPEIVISKELSDLRNEIDDNTPNFVSVNSVSCLKGVYPAPLMREWDIFHKEKRSENDRPDIFDKDQLFILFNFEDGGSALESFKFSNVRQAHSILQQVAYGLAIAESALEFEHRDLHWGNVLVRPSSNETLHLRLKGEDIYLPTCGLETCIIDFTMSRLRKDGCTVFCDISTDELLFAGEGDYQFDVYRLMREEIENQWDRFCPKTNVFWIHYLADKLLKCKKYDKTSSREDNEILRTLRQFVRDGTDYTSATHLVSTCPFIMAPV